VTEATAAPPARAPQTKGLTISAVIPCLNRAPFLRRTIDSVVEQDYPNVECIVVDGESTDETVEILKSYGERIRWVSEPDRGHSHAINKGWAMATGEILTWINADDAWVLPDAARRAAAYLEEHPEVDVVYGDSTGTDDEGNVVGMAYGRPFDLEYAVVNCDHCIPQPAAFMRRTILDKVGWVDESFHSKKDHELWLRIGLQGKIQYTPQLFAHSRFEGGYMAQRGDITAEACVRLTETFFRLPGLPASLAAKRRRAISNAYLRGAQYAEVDGRHWEVVHSCLRKAVASDPSNAPAVTKQARRQLSSNSGSDPRLRSSLIPARAALSFGRALRSAMADTRSWAHPTDGRDASGRAELEAAWVGARLARGEGQNLLETSTRSLALNAALSGYRVTSVILNSPTVSHPSIQYITAFDRLPIAGATYGVAVSVAALEVLGVGRQIGLYDGDPDADLALMGRLRRLIAGGGRLLISVPVGVETVFPKLRRIYGSERLEMLTRGFTVEESSFWSKDSMNRWTTVSEASALSDPPRRGQGDMADRGALYNLGLFELRRPR